MHNIALDLHAQGHIVTGSDDEIYEPSLSRLQKAGIAPKQFGWFPDKITSDTDIVILGMHAKADNPELKKHKIWASPYIHILNLYINIRKTKNALS